MTKPKRELDLKPCPFCGEEAEVEETIFGDVAVFSVGCLTEDCFGYQSFVTFPLMKAAVEAWNTRPIEDDLEEKAYVLERD